MSNGHLVLRDHHNMGRSGFTPWWGMFGTSGVAFPAPNQRETFRQVFARIYRVERHYTCTTTGGDQEEVPRHLWDNLS